MLSAQKSRKERAKAAMVTLALAAAAAGTGAMAVSAQGQPLPIETTAFERVWQRADLPVAESRAKRSWLWGPKAIAGVAEPLVEGKNGMRQVQYFDKSRMEINDPQADPNSPWYVSNGLLVVEMISGRLQLGANTFEQREPVNIAVAGDTITAGPGNVTPSYAALRNVATLQGRENSAPPRIGQPITQTLGPDGRVTVGAPQLTGRRPVIKYYESMTLHNVPDVFYDYMNASGMVYENGQYKQGQVFNWIYAVGYPVTEPYWITIEIGGKRMPVMMQAFQRRLLTYNPANDTTWQVEMGNVGMQYYEWRYGKPPAPTPSPTPGPSQETRLEIRRFVTPDMGSRQYSGIHEELFAVVTREADWDALWARDQSNSERPHRLPKVEFSTEFVVGAWWGDKPNGCYKLDIERVTFSGASSGGTIKVLVNRREVSGGCSLAITQPYDIVTVKSPSRSGVKHKIIFVDTSGKTLREDTVSIP